MILLSARSARESLRSTVLLRRLYVRRAAVIYSTGCAALNGEERRFQQARAELRLLDELITAASSQTTLPYTAEDSAAAAPAELPTEAPADVPTEESVLMPRATVRVPALRQSQM